MKIARASPFPGSGNIAVALGLFALSVPTLQSCDSGKAKGAQYQTAKVDRASVIAKVSATGTLSAIVTVQVGSQVSGRIIKLWVDFNSLVKKGQLLANIDPDLYSAAVEMAKANVLAAEGNLAKARAQARDARLIYNRTKLLNAQGVASQQDLDTSQANADALDAQTKADEGTLAQVRAVLHQAQLNLGYTRIVSPVNGIVVLRNVDLGQTVAATLQAPLLFLIAEDLKKMQIDTSVAEADVGRLREGMIATFTLDAYPGQTFEGKILQVRNNPTTVSNVVTYDAVVDVDNKKLLFKPGMTANVTVVTDAAVNVVRVPNAAMRFQPPVSATSGAPAPAAPAPTGVGAVPGADRTVWILRAGKPAMVHFKTGISDGTFTEVAGGGLREGDVVITDILGAGPASGAFRAF